MIVPLFLVGNLHSIAAQSTICNGKCIPLNYGDKISFSNSGTAVNSNGISHPQISCDNCNVDSTEIFKIECIYSGLNNEENIVNWKCYPSNKYVLVRHKVSCEGVRQTDDTEYIYENSCSIAVSVENSAISDLFHIRNKSDGYIDHDQQSSIGSFFTIVARFSGIDHGIVSFFGIGEFFVAIGRFLFNLFKDIVFFFEYATWILLGVVLYNLIKYCYEPFCHWSKGWCQNLYYMCEGCYDCLNHPSYYRLPTYDNSTNLNATTRSRATDLPRPAMTFARLSSPVSSVVISTDNLPRPDYVVTESSKKFAEMREFGETFPPPMTPAFYKSQVNPARSQSRAEKQVELQRLVPENSVPTDYGANKFYMVRPALKGTQVNTRRIKISINSEHRDANIATPAPSPTGTSAGIQAANETSSFCSEFLVLQTGGRVSVNVFYRKYLLQHIIDGTFTTKDVATIFTSAGVDRVQRAEMRFFEFNRVMEQTVLHLKIKLQARSAYCPTTAKNNEPNTLFSATSTDDKIVISSAPTPLRWDELNDGIDLHYSKQRTGAKSVNYYTSVPATAFSAAVSTFASTIKVENIPAVSSEKIPKLLGVLLKIYAQMSKITEADIHMPFNEDTQTTYGFCFIKFANKDEAENAMKLTQGLAIDKKHTFKISLYSDLDMYSKPHPSPPPVVITDLRKPSSGIYLKEFNALSKNGTDVSARDVYIHYVLPLFVAGSITAEECRFLFKCSGNEDTINLTLSYQQFERIMEKLRNIPTPVAKPAVGSYTAAVATPIATVVDTPVTIAVGVQSAPTLPNPASKCVQDFSTLSTLRAVPSKVLEVFDCRPPPPQESMKNEGYWEEGDKFKGKKSFGHFRCACGNSWISAHATKGKWQGCKGCENRLLPKYMWVNYEGRRGQREVGEEGGSDRGPHDLQRCQRCNELGYGCWNE